MPFTLSAQYAGSIVLNPDFLWFQRKQVVVVVASSVPVTGAGYTVQRKSATVLERLISNREGADTVRGTTAPVRGGRIDTSAVSMLVLVSDRR